MARMQDGQALEIDGTRLTLAQLREFEASRPRVQLAGSAREGMQLSVAAVERASERGAAAHQMAPPAPGTGTEPAAST